MCYCVDSTEKKKNILENRVVMKFPFCSFAEYSRGETGETQSAKKLRHHVGTPSDSSS
jgi:hypothetical protein